MREITIFAYLACLGVALVLVAASHLPERKIASITELLDQILVERAPRFALVLFWWWLGWHFFVGQTVDPPIGG